MSTSEKSPRLRCGDTYSMYQGILVQEIVTGKPVGSGGTLGRREATDMASPISPCKDSTPWRLSRFTPQRSYRDSAASTVTLRRVLRAAGDCAAGDFDAKRTVQRK